MDWIDSLQKAIDYIEEHLLEGVDGSVVAQHIHFSKDHFQKIFHIITGVTINEYIRNRRLSMAAKEVAETDAKIIDIAGKYRYESPESFTKAFSRLYGFSPSEMRKKRIIPKTFSPFTIQIVLKGGFSMAKILDVRRVGWVQNIQDDRSPESFTFPACITSQMEQLGKDVGWRKFSAHGREWSKRRLYEEVLCACGMAFGLLWREDNCPSCTDLTMVNEHNKTITIAYGYVGNECEIIESTNENHEEMKQMIKDSIDLGRPVLAFGLAGPPECSIICGYDHEGDVLLGWSHFQSYDPADCFNNGMFQINRWQDNIWKIVLCKDEKTPEKDLGAIIRHGLNIMEATELSGYWAGTAAYDKWIRYVDDPIYETMGEEQLMEAYILHQAVTGNHAEARWCLRDFLYERANGNEYLEAAAQYFIEIHNTCWKIWNAAGGIDAPDAYKSFRDSEKRKEITGLIEHIRALDLKALDNLKAWTDSH